jgi:hypothetical protein
MILTWLGRISMIALVVAVSFWYGISYGPVRGVKADIYMKLASTFSGNPDPAGNQPGAREGTTLMNSGKIHYRVYQSPKSLHEVLDGYEKALVPAEFHLIDRKRLPASFDADRALPQLPFLEALVNRSRVVRQESSTWGYLSYLDLGPEANQDWHAVFRKKAELFARTQRLGDLGTARTVVAVPNHSPENRTTVMSYWTDPDFNLKDLVARGEGDAPGRDIDSLPRIKTLRRVLTFDQVEEKLGFLIVMYETPLPPAEVIEAFTVRARAGGWNARPWKDSAEPVLFLERGGSEVTVFAHRQSGKTSVVTTQRTAS